MEQRLQKIISDYGLASRRAAEVLIAQGKVKVNSETAKIGDKADVQTDTIEVDGKVIETRPERVYIMLNKPRGYVTTISDERGRKKVTDLLRGLSVKVYPVGRLDMYSEGLLLLTNDGEMANRLMHPSFQVRKTYRVWVSGENVSAAGEVLRGEMYIDGQKLNPAKVGLITRGGSTGIFDITISEGKNRQIRKMCSMAGFSVSRLVRTRESGLELGQLPKGAWRFLTGSEIEHLKSI